MSDDDFKRQVIEALGALRAASNEHSMQLLTLTRSMGLMEGDIIGLKQDVSGLKQDVSGLKQDVSGLKQDVSGLKQDVSGLKQDVAGLNDRVDRLERESLASNMAILREVQQVHADVAYFGSLADVRFTEHDHQFTSITHSIAELTSVHASSTALILRKLDDHERRITALEGGGGGS